MSSYCGLHPCGMTSSGCVFAHCPQYPAAWNSPLAPPMMPVPMGCICPPTSEQTCQNPACPRRDPYRATFGTGHVSPLTT
jgi:hypothetical protein